MEEQDSIAIDLGKLIEILVRQWQLIVSLTLIFALLASLITVSSPKTYTAKVVIASTKTSSNVSFGSNIQTVSESQLLASGSGAYGLVDRKSRQQSYVVMVDSPTVAQQVLDKLGTRLEARDRNVNRLLAIVDGKIVPNSDSLEIDVRYQDPTLAADIANTWAESFVREVNAVYSEGGKTDSYTAIQGETTEAKKAYDQAQANLVEFFTNSRIDELNRRIGEQVAVITSLVTARNTAINTIVNQQTKNQLDVIQQYYYAESQNQLLALQRDQDSRRQLISAYINALQTMRQKTFDEQVNDVTNRLAQAYADQRNVDQQLEAAQNMRDQVQKGGAGAATSNSLALTLLKVQVFAGSSSNPALSSQTNNNQMSLQLQASPAILTADAMLADLDGLISTLKSRQAVLANEVRKLSEQLVDNKGLQYTDKALDPSGDLAKTIQDRYPELFQVGSLASLSLDAAQNNNPLSDEAQTRAKSLLGLKGLEGVLAVSTADSPIEQKIKELEKNVRLLQADLAGEVDHRLELTRARDLAWNTYKTLATKQAELAVAVQTRGTEVALASPAAIPDRPSSSISRNGIIGAAFGFVLSILISYLVEFWWSYKRLQPHPLLNIRFHKDHLALERKG